MTDNKASPFGEYAIVDAVTHEFDKEPSLWWIINPPTSGDDLNVAKLLNQRTTKVKPDGSTVEQFISGKDVMHREIALTFGGTNIPADATKPVEKGGEPYIKPEEKLEQREAKIRAMPDEMLQEIWKALGEAVPTWGPTSPKEMEEE